MKKRWMVICDKYSGITKRAADILYSEISSLVGYVLPAKTSSELEDCDKMEYNLILIGLEGSNKIFKELFSREKLEVSRESESYSIYV